MTDSLTRLLARGRARAAMRMRSRATIRREAGRDTNAHGEDVNAWTVVHRDVPVQLMGRTGPGQSRTVTIGDTEHEVATLAARLPWNLQDLRDGDWLDFTRGEKAGRVYRVVEADGAEQQTALRVTVYAVRRPSGWE